MVAAAAASAAAAAQLISMVCYADLGREAVIGANGVTALVEALPAAREGLRIGDAVGDVDVAAMCAVTCESISSTLRTIAGGSGT